MSKLLSKLRSINIDIFKYRALQFIFTNKGNSFDDIGDEGKDGFYQIQIDLPLSYSDNNINDEEVYQDIKKNMIESIKVNNRY